MRCRLCGADIRWVRVGGGLTPIDRDPTPDGTIGLTSEACGFVADGPSLFGDLRYRLHTDVCPRRTLPAQAHSEESRDAAVLAADGAPRDRDRVLQLIAEHGPMTDEQIADRLAMNPSTARPRRIELAEDGLIVKVGRLENRSGRKAAAWQIAS